MIGAATEILLIGFLPALGLIFNRRDSAASKSAGGPGVAMREENVKDWIAPLLSGTVFADDLQQSLSSLASGIREALGAKAFIFQKKENSLDLAAFSVEDSQRIAELLVKLGLRLDVHEIPLSPERNRIFSESMCVIEDPFDLIGDMTTTAACRKIKRELQFDSIVTASVAIDTLQFAIVVLLGGKPSGAGTMLAPFVEFLKSAIHISKLKKKVAESEISADLGVAHSDDKKSEPARLQIALFSELPFAAAFLDKEGIIIRSNDLLSEVVGRGDQLSGKPFSMLVDDEHREEFTQSLLNSKQAKSTVVPVRVLGQEFKAHIAVRSGQDGELSGWTIYLTDNSSEIELQRELDRSVQASKSGAGLSERIEIASAESAETLVKGSAVPVLAVSGNTVEFASESCKTIFDVREGQLLDDFLLANRLTAFKGTESTFEVSNSRGLNYLVVQWNAAKHRFYVFADITESKRLERKLTKSAVERDKLFNSLLPTALIKDDALLDWNDAFARLFDKFLFSQPKEGAANGFVAFLEYLGESPDDFRRELNSTGSVTRNYVTDEGRKAFVVFAVTADDSAFLFVQDKSEKAVPPVEVKSEDSGRVIRALVGLTGIGTGSFEEVARKTVDVLRRVLDCESAGAYSPERDSISSVAVNGTLPISIPNSVLKFGAFLSWTQLEPGEGKTSDASYFAARSRSQKLILIFKFSGLLPSVSELSAISSIALDLLDARNAVEMQTITSVSLSEEKKFMSEFMTNLARSTSAEEAIKVVEDALLKRSGDARVSLVEPDGVQSQLKPLEITERVEGNRVYIEVNLSGIDIGYLAIECQQDELSRAVAALGVDKLRSLSAPRITTALNQAADLRSRLDRARDEYGRLRESVEGVPGSMRKGLDAINHVVLQLRLVSADPRLSEDMMRSLETASSEMEANLENFSKGQDDLFDAVRLAIIQSEGSREKGSGAHGMLRFETSALAEMKIEPEVFEIMKNLFTEFVTTVNTPEYHVLMMTAQASPKEQAEGKGKHIILRLTGKESELLHDDAARESKNLMTMSGSLGKLGYQVDTRAIGNELTMDICEERSDAGNSPA